MAPNKLLKLASLEFLSYVLITPLFLYGVNSFFINLFTTASIGYLFLGMLLLHLLFVMAFGNPFLGKKKLAYFIAFALVAIIIEYVFYFLNQFVPELILFAIITFCVLLAARLILNYNLDFFNVRLPTKKAIAAILILFFAVLIVWIFSIGYRNHITSFLICGITLIALVNSFFVNSYNAYLRVLNGDLINNVYIIDRDSFIIGSLSSDNLNLNSYHQVEPSHVNLVVYDSPKIFTVINNYYLNKFSVNFRSSEQQILEDGDIMEIGAAKLQFFINK